jgi:TetR/AcrR family transcriptional repressor of bet genes
MQNSLRKSPTAQSAKSSNGRAEARAKRRSQLIDATMKCIARRGIGGTTLSDVASEAGLSQGIVNLHFESKDNLLRETLEALAGEYRAQFERASGRSSESAAAGLQALMELDLSPSICQPAKLAVCFAFWGEVKSRPTYRKICDEIDSYYDRVVERLCAEIVEEGGYDHITAGQAATALTAMTNGLWLSCLISPQEWNRHAALDAVMAYLGNVFPKHFRNPGTP